MNDRAPLSRIALGAVVLAGERLGLIDRPTPRPLALLVGAAGKGRDAARRLARAAGELAPRPPERMRRLLGDTRERGERTIRTGRLEAKGRLQTLMDDSIRWAESTVLPRIVDDMTPRVFDAAMPQIQARIVPLIAEQSHGVISDAADELRETSARADDRLESGFRRLFRT